MLKNNIISSLLTFLMASVFSFLCSQTEMLSGLLPFVFMIIFAVCSALCEKEYAAVAGAFSVIFTYIVSKDLTIIYTAIVSAIAGVVLGQMIKKRMSVMTLTVSASAGMVVLYALYIFIFAKMNGFSSLNEIFDMFSNAMLSTVGGTDEATLETVRASIRMLRDLFPSIAIISAATSGYLIVFITGGILSIGKSSVKTDMGFSKLRADLLTTVIFVIAMAVTIFADYGIVGIIAENVYTILMFVLQICGLSLLDYVLKNVKNMKLPFRILILLFVFSTQIFSIILVMAAMLDARRNFRRLS